MANTILDNVIENSNAQPEADRISGKKKAAILMLSLGTEYGQPIWENLFDEEIKEISSIMSQLGEIDPNDVEDLLVNFAVKMTNIGAVSGNFNNTEQLLGKFLPEDRVNNIMEEIRGPAGRNMWEKLSNVQEHTLANYLKNEYPQTVAVILSKVRAEHAAKVLSNLPDEFAFQVMERILNMEVVQKEIIEEIEDTLRKEFMSNLVQKKQRDAFGQMADIFNNFDRQIEGKFMSLMEESDRDAAEKIKSLMFTFDDMKFVEPAGVQMLLRSFEKDRLALALKGASEEMKDFFFRNMSGRAAGMLQEDMEVLGPVRLKDVDEAQMELVNLTKDLAARGDVEITKGEDSDELVY